MTFNTVYPNQTIVVEISAFNDLTPLDLCELELNHSDYSELIDRIDFKPTGIKSFHFADNGECIKIVFQTRDGEKTFYFGQEQDSFDFQEEANRTYFDSRGC